MLSTGNQCVTVIDEHPLIVSCRNEQESVLFGWTVCALESILCVFRRDKENPARASLGFHSEMPRDPLTAGAFRSDKLEQDNLGFRSKLCLGDKHRSPVHS